MTQRTRTKSDPVVSVTDGFVDDTTNFVKKYDVSFMTSAMTDVVTPGYEAAIARGEMVNNDMDFFVQTAYEPVEPGSAKWNNTTFNGKSLTGFFSGGYPKGVSTEVVTSPGLEATAKQSALANVDSTPLEMIEDIGEIKETINFLKSPFDSLKLMSEEFNKAAERMSRRRAISFGRAAAGLWLTWQFAVTPLFRSIFGLAEQLGQDIERSHRETAHGYAHFTDKVEVELLKQGALHRAIARDKNSYHASIVYGISNPAGDWRYQYGLRLKDLPKGIWQLAPLSFLLDRMLNISSMIGGLVNLADPNLSILAGAGTSRSLRDIEFSVISFAHNNMSDFQSNTERTDKFVYKRRRWEPSGWDTIPSFNFGGLIDSATKLTDVAAIIYSNFTSPKRR